MENCARTTGALIAYKSIVVELDATHNIHSLQDEHQRRNRNERPVIRQPFPGGSPYEQFPHAHPERDEKDSVCDRLKDQRDQLGFVDGQENHDEDRAYEGSLGRVRKIRSSL